MTSNIIELSAKNHIFPVFQLIFAKLLKWLEISCVILNESILLFGQFARRITHGFKTIIRNERFRDNL